MPKKLKLQKKKKVHLYDVHQSHLGSYRVLCGKDTRVVRWVVSACLTPVTCKQCLKSEIQMKRMINFYFIVNHDWVIRESRHLTVYTNPDGREYVQAKTARTFGSPRAVKILLDTPTEVFITKAPTP